jgi:hypothetical protein
MNTNIKKTVSSFLISAFTIIGIGFSAKVGYKVYQDRIIAEPEPFTYITKAIKITEDQAVQTIADFTEKFQTSQTKPKDEYQKSLIALTDIVSHTLKYIQKEDSLESHTRNKLIAEFKSLDTQIAHLTKYYARNPLSESSLSGIAGDATEVMHKINLERKKLGLVNRVESSLKKLVNILNGEEEESIVAHTADDGIMHAHSLLAMLVR